MKTTVINTSKEMTAYSDFPPPPEFTNFMHNRKMLEYFELYTKHFKLDDYIRFNHRVENVERAPSYKQDGKWLVTYTDENGNCLQEEFDGVLLASGHHTFPYLPEKWTGQDSFKGKVTHAHSYKDHRGYEDKVVAVVGVGNSGGDIAVDLSRIAKQVYLVTRRGTWVFNRVVEYGEPYDIVLVTRFYDFLRSVSPLPLTSWFVHQRLQRRFDHEKYGLKPAHGMFSAHPTVNDELPNRLACGTVIVKPNIKEFTETGLIFEDDSRVDNVDEVILSTGYSFGFPMAEHGKLIPVKENEVTLYEYMYPPELSDHNSLAVLGLIQPLGSIMPISEMQARVFYDVLTGHSKLPTGEEMLADINGKKEEMAKRYVKSRRHTIQVDYGSYMDRLGK
uniref:Flavin-containing monooxygenase n=1 Tax=Acrobeloides nanus TaxID=290746 RepID=A0A914CYJ3_9BILA